MASLQNFIKCLQKSTECLDEYLQALKLLARDCNFQNLTGDQVSDQYICDVFNNGLHSSSVAFQQARSMELALHQINNEYNHNLQPRQSTSEFGSIITCEQLLLLCGAKISQKSISEIFTDKELANNIGLNVEKQRKKISMAANKFGINIYGSCSVQLRFDRLKYTVKLSVGHDLCCDVILGLDFIEEHASAKLNFKIEDYRVDICAFAQARVQVLTLFHGISSLYLLT
ncbi:hypothetical protein GJ496_004687 [Pomphorhynchus laevis]|nr:hypothetical protein GJ496_004687 [Pomphorhynchus laevis]